MKHVAHVLALCLLLVSAEAALASNHWNQWRGPNRDGVVSGVEIREPLPKTLSLGWRVEVGKGHASPLVVGDRIYLHTRQGEAEVVSCLRLSDRKQLWSKRYEAPFTPQDYARAHGKGPWSTPALAEGALYTNGITGVLSCFDAATGDLRWRNTFEDRVERTYPQVGAAMSPIVDDSRVIVHVGAHDTGSLLACDVETGDVVWSWDEDGPAYASPVMADFDGTRQIVTQSENRVISVAAETGEPLWDTPFNTPFDQNTVTPLVYGDLLILSGLEQGVAAIRPTKTTDGWTLESAWTNKDVSMFMCSPVLNGNRLFGLSHLRKGQFFMLDADTGEKLWTSDGRQGEYAAIERVGNLFFSLLSSADLIVTRADADAYAPVAQYRAADSQTWAHPVLLNIGILIKDDSNLTLWRIE